MINAHESGRNSMGAGTFSRDLTKTDFTWALHMEKSISPLFPGHRGTWLQMTGALSLPYNFFKLSIKGTMRQRKQLNLTCHELCL